MKLSNKQPAVASHSKHWDKLSLPLRECGEVASLRLANAFSDALEEAAEQLFVDATQALTPHDRESCLNASEFARSARHGMVCDFMRHFEVRYVQACEYRHNPLFGHNVDFDIKNLKVVEHHVLDDSLAPGMITESIQNVCWHILQKLTTQFQRLLGTQTLSVGDLPLGPRVIELVVAGAINDQVTRHGAKQRLERALRWSLASRVGQFYRDLADHLNAQDLRHNNVAVTDEKSTQHASAATSPTLASAEKKKNAATQSATESAIEAAKAEVTRCLEATRLPQQASRFVSTHWQTYLSRVYNADTANREAWDEAVSTMDDLAWSLREIADAEALSRFKAAIPGLLKRLSTGMDALGLDQETRGNFYFFLTKQHAEGIKKAAQLPQPVLEETASKVAVGSAVQSVIAPAEEHKAASLPVPAHTPADTIAEHEVEPVETAAIQTDESCEPEQPEVQPMEDLLAALSVGTWIDVSETGAATKELKLAWISPRKSLYLLTHREGQREGQQEGERALSLSSASLLALFNEGRASVKQMAPQTNSAKNLATAESTPLPLRKTA